MARDTLVGGQPSWRAFPFRRGSARRRPEDESRATTKGGTAELSTGHFGPLVERRAERTPLEARGMFREAERRLPAEPGRDQWAGGETGRHAGLKIPWPKGRVGSTPTLPRIDAKG